MIRRGPGFSHVAASKNLAVVKGKGSKDDV
jgi:hypothetical protein